MAVQKVRITHLKQAGVGSLYLSDVGRRVGLGGGCSIYEYGQDCYLNPAVLNAGTPGAGKDVLDLVATSQVLLSIDRGMLHALEASGDVSIAFL